MKTLSLYIFCEIISLFFMYLATKMKKNNHNSDGNKKSTRRINLFFIMSLLPFAILFALRSAAVGRDYTLYFSVYLRSLTGTLSTYEANWLGIGLQILYKLSFSLLNNDFRVLLSFISIFALFLFYYSIYKYSEKPVMSLFILFCFGFHLQIFNQFKQFLAISIVFYCLHFLKEKKYYRYIFGILIASCFHSSALVMLLALITRNKKIDARYYLIYMIMAVMFIFSFSFIVDIIQYTKYGIYFDTIYNFENDSSKYNMILRLLLMIFCLINYKKICNKQKNDNNVNYLYHLIIFCTLFQILALKSYIIARVTTYFFSAYIFLLPSVIETFLSKLKGNIEKVMIMIIFIGAFFAYKIVYYNSSSGAVGGGYAQYVTYMENGGK